MNRRLLIGTLPLVMIPALMLTGCQSILKNDAGVPFQLTEDLQGTLPPAAYSTPWQTRAVMTARREGKTERALAVTVFRDNVLTLELMTLSGLPLMTITYRDGTVTSKKHLPVPDVIRPAQILGDLLLATLAPHQWVGHLPSEVALTGSSEFRKVVTKDGQLIEMFTISHNVTSPVPQPLTIKHGTFGYTLDFRYLEDKAP